MADATKLPTSTQMRYFDWKGDPHFTRNPAIDGSGTYTLYWSAQPLDKDDALITGGFLVSASAKDGETYTFWVPASAVAADGLSASGCVGGIRPNGLDYTTKDTTFVPASTTILSGMKIACGIPAVLGELLRGALQGVIQTGSVTFDIGTGASEDVYIKHNGNPWLKQTSAGVAQYYNGASYVNISDTQSSTTFKVSAADTTADYLYEKIDVATDGELTKAIGSPAGNEKLQLGLATTLTKAEMDAIHTGISANVTGTNLATLTAGGASSADSLHTHAGLAIFTGTAGEAIDGSTTPVLVAKLGNNYRDRVYIQATNTSRGIFQASAAGTTMPIGNADATTWLGMSFSYTDALATTITLREITADMIRVLNPSGTMYIEIQTDSSGSPSGTVVTNGTSTAITANTIDTSRDARTFSWATPPTLTSGTTYWMVFKRSVANDAANYISCHRLTGGDITGYATKTYTASTTTWSSAVATDLNVSFLYGLDYDGKIVKASNADLTRANIVGITKSNVTAGQSITYYGEGAFVSGFTGLTEGVDYFMGASGAYTASPTFAYPDLSTPGDFEILSKAFIAVSSTSAQVNFGRTLSVVTQSTANTLANNAAAATYNSDVFIETGFRPDLLTIYRFAASSVVAETAEARGATLAVVPVASWGSAPAVPTFFSITEINENGFTMRIPVDVVDNVGFGYAVVAQRY